MDRYEDVELIERVTLKEKEVFQGFAICLTLKYTDRKLERKDKF